MARRDFGVALGIPEPWTGQLQDWRERLGDPNAAGIPPHVTLLPPTALHDDDVEGVEEHLRVVASGERAFALHLQGTGTFRPVSPVVFVEVVEGAGDCARVQAAVRSGPLSRELGFPYHPHVTVAHHLRDEQLDEAFEALADFDCHFEVRGFHLYEHGSDGVWRPEQGYQFGGGATIGVPAWVSVKGSQ